MKPNIIVVLLLYPIFVFSCKNKSANVAAFNPDLLESFVLESEKTTFLELKNPVKIFSKDDLLIITENSRISPDLPLVHVFLKEPLTHLSSKGTIGFGPNEIPSADMFNPGDSDSTFLIYSGMDRKFVKYNIYDSSRLGISEYKLPVSEPPIPLGYLLPDSTFIGMPTYGENKFVEVDLQGKKINGYGEWEQIEGKKEMSFFHHFLLNNGWFKTDDNFTLFVNASIFRDRLEIFNPKTKEIKTIDGPSGELPEFKFYDASMPLDIPITNPFRYRDVYISKDRIYALYGGFNEAHYIKTSEIAKTIFIFTRTGEPILKFDLDRSIRSIVVDEKLNTIYGITTDEDPGIAAFKVPPGVL